MCAFYLSKPARCDIIVGNKVQEIDEIQYIKQYISKGSYEGLDPGQTHCIIGVAAVDVDHPVVADAAELE